MGEIPKVAPPVPPRRYVSGGHWNCGRDNGITRNFMSRGSRSDFNVPLGQSNGDAGMLFNSTKFIEQSFRGAFQNFEAFVAALTSVANMLTAMQNAAYSTIAALIGITDQYRLLKSQLFSLIYSLPLFRWVRFLWQKLVEYLHLKPEVTVAESAWSDATLLLNRSEKHHFSGANVLFWVFLLSGPYLIYKSLKSFLYSFENSKWATGEADHYCAEALFDFQSQFAQELSFRTGDRFRIAPKRLQPAIKGWVLGSAEKDGQIGLIPINYIQLIKKALNVNDDFSVETDMKQLVSEISNPSEVHLMFIRPFPSSRSLDWLLLRSV